MQRLRGFLAGALATAFATGLLITIPTSADAAPTTATQTARSATAAPTARQRSKARRMVPVQPVTAHRDAMRSWEWRRLDRTPLAELTAAFPAFRALGGTAVALDISYIVDISEIATPRARAAAQRSYTRRLRSYVAAAARAGLAVEAAAGSPHWIGPDVRYVNRIVQRFVSAFNAKAPVTRRLAGVHFDLEPWATPEWAQNAAVLTTHLLESVAEIAATQRATAPRTRVPVTVDLPFWLDGTTAPQTVPFAGRTASPTEHVMRLLDNGAGMKNSVAIMAYRDTVGGVDGSAAVSATELDLAEQFAGRVLVTIGQEVGDVEPARITFFEEGLSALTAALAQLRATHGGRTGFGGFAIDDLAGLARLV